MYKKAQIRMNVSQTMFHKVCHVPPDAATDDTFQNKSRFQFSGSISYRMIDGLATPDEVTPT